MRCPRCGSECSVLETRTPNHYTTRRRYECEKAHRFTTFEVLPAGISKRDQQASVRACEKARALWERNEAIYETVRSGATTAQTAKAYEMTDARIRQIIVDINKERESHARKDDGIYAPTDGRKLSPNALFSVWFGAVDKGGPK